MDQVKSQENKRCDIEDHKGQHFEFINDFGGKIMVHYSIHMISAAMTKFGLEIKIHEMDHQEDQDNDGRVDHKL